MRLFVLVGVTAQCTNPTPLFTGSPLRLSGRHPEVRRSGYRQVGQVALLASARSDARHRAGHPDVEVLARPGQSGRRSAQPLADLLEALQ